LEFASDFDYRVTKGINATTFNDTPVGYNDRRNACVENSVCTIKIEPCTSHHYGNNFICAYCGKEYYESVTGTWEDENVRAATFSAIDVTQKTITIQNEAELGLLSYNTKGPNCQNYEDWTITLGKDLDMSAHRWAIIDVFYGIFDGNGHTIKGLNTAKDNHGCAGFVEENFGTIRNLVIAGSIFIGTSYAGAIAAYNYNKIENCHVAADVAVMVTGSAEWQGCGGIVGKQDDNGEKTVGTTIGCYSEASVSGYDIVKGYDNVGGIIGEFEDGTLSNCVSKATVTGTSANKGILVGKSETTAVFGNNFYLADAAVSNANATRLFNVWLDGRLVDDGYSIVAASAATHQYDVSKINIYDNQVKIGDNWYVADGGTFKFSLPANTAGHENISWCNVTVNGAAATEVEGENGVFSFHVTDNTTKYVVDASGWEGQGTAENPYKIQDTSDWNMLCSGVMTAAVEKPFEGKYFKQTANFDVTQGIGVTGEINTKTFCGTYDGDSHRLACNIINPVKNSTEAVAPFHRIKDATIKNLHISGIINGGMHTGGIAAFTDGTVTIDNCRVSADITCTGKDGNDAHGGGIVGHANTSTLTVKNCLFDGKLTATPNGQGDIRLGAIVGWAGTTVAVEGCLEHGTYSGITDNGQTAFCWKDENNTTVNSSSANLYVSNLAHGDGADKGMTVVSGTEGLELDFNVGDWKEAYFNAVFKDTEHSNFIIGGKFYTSNGKTVPFKVTYPTTWKNVKILANGNERTANNGVYEFQQGSESTTITATYGIGNVNFIDNSSNEDAIKQYDGMPANVTLQGRTLYKDGHWNTICLPFNVVLEGSPLEGATVKTLVSSTFEGGTLTLNFSTSSLTTIEAGKPYIIKWTDSNSIIENPVFSNVTISKTIVPVGAANDPVIFKGSYDILSFAGKTDKTILYMGSDSKLYYPDGTSNEFVINAFRACFYLQNGLTADELNDAPGVRNFVLNFGDEGTGIKNLYGSPEGESKEASPRGGLEGVWYTLYGRKLSGEPTQKGIYIHNGRKIVLR